MIPRPKIPITTPIPQGWFQFWFRFQGLPKSMIPITISIPVASDSDSVSSVSQKKLDSESELYFSIMWFWFQFWFQKTRLWFWFWFRNLIPIPKSFIRFVLSGIKWWGTGRGKQADQYACLHRPIVLLSAVSFFPVSSLSYHCYTYILLCFPSIIIDHTIIYALLNTLLLVTLYCVL